MPILQLLNRSPSPGNTEQRLRTALGLLFVIGIGVFYLWFIATHLGGMGDG